MNEKYRRILAACDHTLLKQFATPEEIRALCEEAVTYGTASVCIPPCYVELAREYMDQAALREGRRMPGVCTVIGFPNGNSTTDSKVFETEDVVRKGADEIDMVINIGMLKAGETDMVRDEIRQVVQAAQGRIVKVIIETCMLTEEEKTEMCGIVTEAGADYIKTSTGFAGGGATFEDVALFAEHIGSGVKIKAAGGISTLADAERFMALGADRLGTSRIVRLVRELEEEQVPADADGPKES